MGYAVKQFIYDLKAIPISEPSRQMAANRIKQRADALLRQHSINSIYTEISSTYLIIRNVDKKTGRPVGKSIRISFMLRQNHPYNQCLQACRYPISVQIFDTLQNPFKKFQEFCDQTTVNK